MSLKIATFNVNGIRARLPIVQSWLRENRPDILCLQEIKCQDDDFPHEALAGEGYRAAVRGQKSFNGVAIISREEPDEVIREFDDGAGGGQARFLAARFGGLWLVNTYVPQGREVGHEAFEYKLQWLEKFDEWLRGRFQPSERLIWLGDVNIAPADIDVYDPEKYRDKVSCHPRERAALERLTSFGFTDLFRLHHPGEKQFTFWDYRLRGGVSRDLGWRIDLIMASDGLGGLCSACGVDMAPRLLEKPSDHTPVVAELEL